MYKYFLFVPILWLLFSCQFKKEKAKPVQIIPKPVKIKVDKIQGFNANSIQISAESELQDIARLLSEAVQEISEISVEVNASKNDLAGTISLSVNKALKHKEGYQLEIENNQVTIQGKDDAGVFYGTQSLLQLMSNNISDKSVNLPALSIEDYPRFQWRGMHLDVSRHFFPKSFIKKYLDVLAMHKLNVFHWHLTDDQGWRIQIDKYPRLTEIAAWRAGTGKERWNYFVEPATKEGPNYGGYYTKDDIREIVEYAKKRQITIVPEIEMPGHTWGVLLAYPELSCAGKSWKKLDDVSFEFSDPFCAGNEKTFEFLEGVLEEVIELFPSEYIHIGGDECKKTPWEVCPHCQKRMKDEKLHDVEELQSYFIKRIEKFVQSKGRKIIGWDEILEGGLAPNAAVMSWRGEDGGIAAAKAGHNVVMVPSDYVYFDKAQIDSEKEKIEIGGRNSLDRVYSYNPMPDALNEEEAKYVLGGQACLWSESVYTEQIAEIRLLPRLSALSEILWTPHEEKDWNSFLTRLGSHLIYLEKFDYEYFVSPPAGAESNIFLDDSYDIELSHNDPDAKIYYTLDGSKPDEQSNLYSDPIQINSDVELSAIAVTRTGVKSFASYATFKKVELQDATQPSDLEPGLVIQVLEGAIQSLDQIHDLKMIKKMVVQSIEIPKEVPEDHFALVFIGYIQIPEDGVYTFATDSDDGSRLYINDQILIDNDGLHGMRKIKDHVALKRGLHKFKVEFFEDYYGQDLVVTYKTSEGEEVEIPSSMLFH